MHRRTHGRTHARTDARKIFTQYSGISSCSLGSTDRSILSPSGRIINLNQHTVQSRRSTAIVVATAAVAAVATAAAVSGHRRCPSRCGRRRLPWAPPPTPSRLRIRREGAWGAGRRQGRQHEDGNRHVGGGGMSEKMGLQRQRQM